MNQEELASTLVQEFGASGICLHQIAHGEQQGKDVYHVTRNDGSDWVLRVYHSSEASLSNASLNAFTSVLLFLEGQGYSAEVVVRPVSSGLHVAHTNLRLLVTTYLGQSLHAWHPANADALRANALFDYAPEILSAFGEALGRLHALPVDDAALPPAGLLLEPEIAWASECLRRCADSVPATLKSDYDFLNGEVQQFDCHRHLPHCLIHNDCNFGNVILTPLGKIALIDWEGSGLGPAILDVGFVLSGCFDKARHHLDREAISAFAEGYCRFRRLTEPERDFLTDAIRFRSLVLLACCFSDRVCGTLPNEAIIYGASYADWQAQYQASSAIADAARKVFSQP